MMKLQHASLSLRVLSKLLCYPDAEMRTLLPEMRSALYAEQALPSERLAELDRFINNLILAEELEAESIYIELFDRGCSTSLLLFEHVHGDSRDRGPAMIDLVQTYEKAGLYLGPEEMPDFLPVVLEFVSTQPPEEARSFLGEMVHIFNVIFSALQKRNSEYACVLAALIELSGQKAHAVEVKPDEPMDSVWQEPTVFDGCSTTGQAKPGQNQTVHFVKNGCDRGGATAIGKTGAAS